MMSSSIVRKIGEDHIVQLLITKDGTGIGGQEPTIEVRRMSDGKFLNHAASDSPYWIPMEAPKY